MHLTVHIQISLMSKIINNFSNCFQVFLWPMRVLDSSGAMEVLGLYICISRRQRNTVLRRSGVQLLAIWSYLFKALVYSSQKWGSGFVLICIVGFSVDGWGCVPSLLFSWGNQSWIFIGGTDAEAETPILWPPDAKNWLFGKGPDAGKDWRWKEKGTTEDEMVRWHHWLDGHKFG